MIINFNLSIDKLIISIFSIVKIIKNKRRMNFLMIEELIKIDKICIYIKFSFIKYLLI